MRRHHQNPAATYVNAIGRTARQIREEAALYEALVGYLGTQERALAISDPQDLRRLLIAYAAEQQEAGKAVLSAPEPIPLGWWLGNIANAVVGAVLALLLAPIALIFSPVYLWLLRPA